jgi:hypothetical protein
MSDLVVDSAGLVNFHKLIVRAGTVEGARPGTVALSDQMILTQELLRFRSRGVVVEPSIPEDEPQISSISSTWNAAQPNYFRRQDHGIGQRNSAAGLNRQPARSIIRITRIRDFLKLAWSRLRD